MRIISFARTMPAILARRKTCTRREWNDNYALQCHKGDVVAGYDRNPRFGGRQICTIKLTENPYKDRYCALPYSDWVAEGFEYLEVIGATVGQLTPREIWGEWKNSAECCWVIRFEIVEIK